MPPPLRLAKSSRGSQYLSLLERQRIATLRSRRLTVRDIARRIGRAPSTVSRELRRNMQPHDGGAFDGELAHARARENARRTRPSRLGTDAGLREVVQDKREEEWSPEQINAWLRLTTRTARRGWFATRRSIRRCTTAPAAGLAAS